MVGNNVAAITDALDCPDPCWNTCVCSYSNLIQATAFTADTTRPVLSSFDFNLNESGSISFNFSEAIDGFSLTTLSNVVIQSSAGADADAVNITGGSVTTTARNQLTLPLTADDLNLIKKHRDLAIDLNSTYISLAEETIYDYNGNPVTVIARNAAQLASTFTLDTVDPELEAYSLNMDTGIVTLVYSETVDAATVTPTDFIIQGSMSATSASVTLTGGNIS
jgi:hypothetical protein